MGSKILVVDDERSIRELVTFRLEHVGYSMIGAENGEEALTLIRQEKPDLVILDVMMPGKSGLEVLSEIRQDEELQGTKILLLSAKGRDQDQQEGVDLGADAYLTKPFRANDLLQKTEELLNA